MTAPGASPLRRGLRRLRARATAWTSGRALVLMYHRIAAADVDPWGLCVSPRHFGEHLDVLRRRGVLASLGQIGRAVAEGRPLRGAVAVTFDDGYADNLLDARPLLDRHDAPATFFLTTGALGAPREFWWDALDRLLLAPGTLPETLHLDDEAWPLGAAARYGADEAGRHRAWRAWEPPPTPRHAAYAALWHRLYPLPDAQKQAALATLRGGPAPAPRPSRRPLTPDEAVALARGGPVEVGAHTVTHPALAALPAPAQADEIRASKAHLEALLGRPVAAFAYPHGAHTDATVALTRAAGFRYACTTAPAVVHPRADPLALPRVGVADEDGEAFDRRLTAWLAADPS